MRSLPWLLWGHLLIACSSKEASEAETAPSASSTLPKDCPEPSCNAAEAIQPQLKHEDAVGNVTVYSTSASRGGACLYGNTDVLFYAAINVHVVPGDGNGQWQAGKICGQCFVVTVLTSDGPRQTVVRVMDKCADAYCGLDLGGQSAQEVMPDGFGRYLGTWRKTSCAEHPEVFDGVPSLFIKDGSNEYWAALQVRNPLTAVEAVDWQSLANAQTRGTLAWSSSIENHFEVPSALLQAGEKVQITVRYVDATTSSATLTSAQLAKPESSYPLD